jgi:hypothetical protein
VRKKQRQQPRVHSQPIARAESRVGKATPKPPALVRPAAKSSIRTVQSHRPANPSHAARSSNPTAPPRVPSTLPARGARGTSIQSRETI